MRTVEFNKPQVIKYLAYTFGIAYIIQVGVAMLYRNGGSGIGQMIMAAMMFVPLLGVKLSGGKAEGMEWKRLYIRRNFKTILIAWFLPAILTTIGAALYFLVFPGHFDLTGAYMANNGAQAALDQLAAQGISYRTYILGSVLACVTYAPLINSVLAFGEEVGWRGFLYPQLKSRFGHK
jgi:membrane protease YdiL (CAAX protease family)